MFVVGAQTVGTGDIDDTGSGGIDGGGNGVGFVVEPGLKGTVADDIGDGVAVGTGQLVVVLVEPTIENPVGGSRSVKSELVAHLDRGSGVGNLGAGGLGGIVVSLHGVGVASVDKVGSVGTVARTVGQGESIDSIRADELVTEEPTGEAVFGAGGGGRQCELVAFGDGQRRGAGSIMIVLDFNSTAGKVVGSNRDSAILGNVGEDSCELHIRTHIDYLKSFLRTRCSAIFPMVKNIRRSITRLNPWRLTRFFYSQSDN